MSLPIDEMLTDLRAVLAAFEASPEHGLLDAVYTETNRICNECENALPDDE